MRRCLNRILSFIFAICIFLSYSITTYAFPKRLLDGTWVDVPLSELAEEVSYFISYGLNQLGVVVHGGNFEQWLKNNDTYKDLYDDNGRLAKNIVVDTETGNVTYKKELMVVLKNAVDDYAKENEPYTIYKTIGKYDANLPSGMKKNMWDTMVNLLNESPSGIIAFGVQDSSYQEFAFTDVGHQFSKISPVKVNDFSVCFYNNETWGSMIMNMHFVKLLPEDEPIKSWEEVKSKSYKDTQYYNFENPMCRDFLALSMSYATKYPQYVDMHNDITYRFEGSSKIPLISNDGRRIRVYNTYADFQNATIGKRSVYYTSKYYDYVPEDLSVSIDDLQKTVDDLKDVIDKLLDQITNDTSEDEIEELLRQILEELKNNQDSGGGGSGGGGGDVTVDIDLSTTNTLLSKILAKVTQIFDKMSETAGNTMDSVVDSIKNLERMLNRYLSAITGDLDDIKGKLDQMTEEEFGEKTDSFLSETMDSFSEIGGVAKTKFPFSLPNDMRLLIERITVKPAENASLHSDTISHVTPYSGEHGGGGSTDGKPNPPGGGGASRPPGGIAYVEQGTAGECFTLSPTGAPLIRCPIVIKSRNIDFSIVIDLSEFDKVATLSRTFLTLLFVYGLLNLTFKVMGLWGDLVE